ncbi:hypothetical protein [Prescottella equi]
MRDETRNTEIEVWEADLTRYKTTPWGSGRTTELVEIGPPRRTGWSELYLGQTLVIGRSVDQSGDGDHRIGISSSNQVSREALTLTEGELATAVEIGQLGGVRIQWWGSRGSWLNPPGAKFDIYNRPTSFRIETKGHYYWILVNPRVRITPPEYQPIASDGDRTDGMRETVPEGSLAYDKLINTLDDLKNYYHQYLEWPPRVSPAVGVPAGEKSSRKRLVALGSALTEFGFPRYEETSRDPALIEWLIEGDLVDLERLRRQRTETIKPKSNT